MSNEFGAVRRFRPLLIAVMALALAQSRLVLADPDSNPSDASSVSASPATDLERLSLGMSEVFEKVKPSVVNIRSITVDRTLYRDMRKLPADADITPTPSTGTGSGVIIDRQGHIVTNNHVVADAEAVTVTLADGRKYKASVVGTDPMTDLAVIQIKGKSLVPARFGDSDKVKTGHLVLAIGSPFRLGHSLSHGIISGTGRSENIDVEIDYKNWLQTDAPINPGNSGGPLINTRGEVIGINVAIATETGGHQGVGFAIPSKTVTAITKVLAKGEKVVRGYLGVSIKPVDDAVAGASGLERPGGVLIEQISEESPAAKSQLRMDDIVLAINGRPISTRDDLQECVAQALPGTNLEFSIWRNQKQSSVSVTVGSQPDGFTTNAYGRRRETQRRPTEPTTEKQSFITGGFADVGFGVENLTPELAKKYHLGGAVKEGVVLTEVDPAGEAFATGLRAGQVILRANGRVLHDIDDLQRELTAEAVATGVRLRVRDDGGEEFNTFLRIR